MPFYERDGVMLAYETWGDESLPPVIALHSFTADARMWHPVATRLADEYWVIAPDLRGHGRSDAPGDLDAYNMATYVEDVRALAAAVGVERYGLVGCSFGGMVALQLATETPEQVAALALSDTSPAPDHPRYTEAYRARERRLAELEAVAAKFGTLELGRRLAHDVREPFLANAVRSLYGRMRTEGFLGAAKARRERPNLVPVLRERLTMPVLIVAGLDDPVVCAVDVMADELPHASVTLFRETGHGVPIFRAERFAELLLEFFRAAEEGRTLKRRRTF